MNCLGDQEVLEHRKSGALSFLRDDHPRLLQLGPYVRSPKMPQGFLRSSLRTARRCIGSRKRARMQHLASPKVRRELGRATDWAQSARASGRLGQHEEPNLRSGSAHDLRHCRRSSRPLFSQRRTGNRATLAGTKSSRTEGALVKVVRPRHGGRVATFTWSNLISSRKQPRPWSRAGFAKRLDDESIRRDPRSTSRAAEQATAKGERRGSEARGAP